MRELGVFIRQLHDRPHIAGLPCDWGSFLRQRIARLQEHHHLSGEWLPWAHSFVHPLLGRKEKLVVLNSDLTSDHVLVTRIGKTWRLSGIIDFGDAMIGHPYYDFTAPLLDHAFGEPALARALLDGYGEHLSNDLMDELSRFVLTHRFWSLADIPAYTTSATPQRFLDRLWGRDNGEPTRSKGSPPPEYA
jgi:hygromycin-B 7''-O-kinase